MAMGTEVVPALKRFSQGTTCGTAAPTQTPAAIARKIHSVR